MSDISGSRKQVNMKGKSIMKTRIKRLLSLSIVLVFAAVFYSMSVCERAYAGKNDEGTTGGGASWASGPDDDNWNDDDSHDDHSSGHKHKHKPHKHWQTSGNKYIDPEEYFLGTTDESDLAIRTDDVERVRITA